MAQTWFYQRQGKNQGPVSADDLKDLARNGLLDGDDLIWPEGADPGEATPAGAALDLSGAPPAVPDWLADVAAQEQKGPTPPPPAPPDPADWLDDLRVWISLDVAAAGKQAAAETATAPEPAAAPPAEPAAVPDWLAGPAEALPGPAPPPSAVPVAPRLAPAELEAAPPAAVPATGEPPAGTVVRQEAEDRQAEKAVQETGFDPRTGQIKDPTRFQQWKVARAGSLTAADSHTNASLMEVFRTARREIEAWIDDERHRAFILHRTPAQIVEIAEADGLLNKYADYGPVMKDKLLQHLAFLVENRQKYDGATGQG